MMRSLLTLSLLLLGGTVASAQPAPRVANPQTTPRTNIIRLVLGAVGPGVKLVGQAATYTLTVENTGNTAARQVVLTHELPAGFRFVSADGGRFDADTRRVTWTWNDLTPGTKKTIRLNADAANAGVWTHKLEAHDERGTRVKAEFATRIESADANKPMEVER